MEGRLGLAAWRAAYVSLALAPFVYGCDMAKQISADVPKKQAADASKAEQASAKRLGVNELIPQGASLMNATYMTQAGTGRLRLCRGELTLKVNAEIIKKDSTGVFQFPKASMDCGILGKLDLTAFLGGFSQSANPEMVVENNVIHVKRLGKGWYDPARPFMPSFLSASKEDLRSLNYSRQIILNDEKARVSDRGAVTIRTLGYPVTYTPPDMKRTFQKVLDFEVRITGFNSNIDKPMHMLFDSLRFRMSLDPIAILSIELSGKARALMDSAKNNPEFQNTSMGSLMGIIPDANSPNASAMDRLFGGFVDLFAQIIPVNIRLDLVAQDGLKDSNVDSGDDLFKEPSESED